MTTHQPTFVLYNSCDQQPYFTLRATNHEATLASETYTSLSAAKAGIEAVRTPSRRPTSSVLRSVNHEIVGTSEIVLNERETGRGDCGVSTRGAGRGGGWAVIE